MKFGRLLGRALGVFFFGVGVLLGMAVLGLAVWGDLEASLFDASIGADATLKTLRCPVMITRTEPGIVRATFVNPSERQISPTIRVRISEGFVSLMRENREGLTLAPGERRTLQWTVTADDAAYGLLVLARVHQFHSYPLPSRTAACGILVLDVPHLTGNQVFALTWAACLGFMAVGGTLWFFATRPSGPRTRAATGAMASLAVVLVVGLLSSLLGGWLLGGVVLVVAILLSLAITAYFLISR